MLPRDIVAIEKVIEREGGFVNDPADAGGATNMGITLRTLIEHRGSPASVSDIKNLSMDEAVEIYHHRYIQTPELWRLSADWLFEAVFDMAVHMGPKRAVLLLQKACCVIEDGILGPVTARVANEMDPVALKRELLRERTLFYARVTRRRPENLKFLVGWIKRGFEVLA